jgi:titin
LCQFDTDLHQINDTLDDLSNQLDDMKGKYGESLAAAKATSQAFVYFEKTVDVRPIPVCSFLVYFDLVLQLLQQRIQTFLDTGEKLLAERHAQSPHIQKNIAQLQDRWNNFKKQVQETRNLIDLSIQFFELVEEVGSFFVVFRVLISFFLRRTRGSAKEAASSSRSLGNPISSLNPKRPRSCSTKSKFS